MIIKDYYAQLPPFQGWAMSKPWHLILKYTSVTQEEKAHGSDGTMDEDSVSANTSVAEQYS
ncbi:hypothetical protein DICVIV_13228 [Dictyocaulus viviparus]|uniref:Uncharacterized protein n=1 Tax=Dictyocaulus viviparus TaxID=29172 RepID=A0A0D8XAM7_DICVI|nr:hypothetical protein DICVIV_13228 [Dictyocaulus viviparus]